MSTKLFYIAFALSFFLAACEDDDETASVMTRSLVGNWSDAYQLDSVITFSSMEELPDHQYGIAFAPDHNFIERKNSGWCGTPPISFADFMGIWSEKDSIVDISVGYWGGRVDYEWKIIHVGAGTLKIMKLSEEVHPDEDLAN